MATTAIYGVPSSGMMILLGAIVAVASYFLGCFNGAVIVSKYILRDDVRNHGSGNAGLTNFHRTFGGALTAVVILCDALKAVAIPTVEVHLSDINSREEFRKHSYVSLVAKKTICGLGFDGYREALKYFANEGNNL